MSRSLKILHHWINFPTLKKAAAGSSETLVPMYQIMLRHMQEERSLRTLT
jgi:hypothetical protein